MRTPCHEVLIKITAKASVWILVLVLGAAVLARAQDNSGGQTAPQGQAGGSQGQAGISQGRVPPPVAGTTTEGGIAQGEQPTPDTRPLTGAERFTAGSFGTERSFLTTTAQVAEYVSGSPGSPITDGMGLVSGNLQLQRAWRRATLAVDYSGGYNMDESNPQLDSYFHQVSISQTFNFRRATLTFTDAATYSPGSPFGYMGYGSAYFPSSSFGYSGFSAYGPTNLNLNYLPNQSILTSSGSQYMNTILGQVSYVLDRRSSVNFGGAFSMLGSTGAGFVNSNQYLGNAGYNYQLNPKDTIGIVYGFTRFGYPGSSGQDFDTHSIQAAYGRRITGRLGLQLTGGPQFFGAQKSWIVSSSLTYLFRSANVSLAYLHSVTGGAGVFAGANSDVVMGAIARSLSRTIRGSLSAGYSHNSSLNQSGVGNLALPSQSAVGSLAFNTEYAQVGVGRPLGRQANVSLNYYLQHQSTGIGICTTGTVCAVPAWMQGFGVALQWQMMPIVLGR